MNPELSKRTFFRKAIPVIAASAALVFHAEPASAQTTRQHENNPCLDVTTLGQCKRIWGLGAVLAGAAGVSAYLSLTSPNRRH